MGTGEVKIGGGDQMLRTCSYTMSKFLQSNVQLYVCN